MKSTATIEREPTGAEIKAARRRLGLTQREFARRMRVSLQTVWRWETAKSFPFPAVRLALYKLIRFRP